MRCSCCWFPTAEACRGPRTWGVGSNLRAPQLGSGRQESRPSLSITYNGPWNKLTHLFKGSASLSIKLRANRFVFNCLINCHVWVFSHIHSFQNEFSCIPSGRQAAPEFLCPCERWGNWDTVMRDLSKLTHSRSMAVLGLEWRVPDT